MNDFRMFREFLHASRFGCSARNKVIDCLPLSMCNYRQRIAGLDNVPGDAVTH